ncbi:MAG: MBL fold metallo-hydrolase [Proteobacteria bacterium]|nr:MAG: MBL fold metallo-hydrolase [Pseudomonadota bacterium]
MSVIKCKRRFEAEMIAVKFWSISFALSVLLASSCAHPRHQVSRSPQSEEADYVRKKGLCPEDSEHSETKLVIHHLDVGMGDSTFIRTPDGMTLLIDGGLPGQGRETILPLLKKCYAVEALDYVLLTHFDQDHLGGLADVIGSIPVRKAIYDPGEDKNTKGERPLSPYTKYRVAMEGQPGKRRVPAPGENNFPETTVRIEVVSVNGKLSNGSQLPILTSEGTPKDDNAISIALKLSYGTFDYFIGGDLTGGGQRKPDVETAVGKIVGDVDVLHANHHGSATSSNLAFIQSLKPESVVISVAEGGMNLRYLLPSNEVLDRLSNAPEVKRVFLTSRGETRIKHGDMTAKEVVLSGDILILAEPDRYQVNGVSFETDGK